MTVFILQNDYPFTGNKYVYESYIIDQLKQQQNQQFKISYNGQAINCS